MAKSTERSEAKEFGEISPSEANEANEAKRNEANETMRTGEAAAKLGVSRQTVRRLIERNELDASWSRDSETLDINGRKIRGHRRVTRASVEAYRERRQAEDVAGAEAP
jgi:orotate phosphoribosyltransferase-like protein